MKGYSKKLGALLLAGSMMMLAACGDEAESNSTHSDVQSSTTASAENSAETSQSSEPVNLSILKSAGQLWDDENPALQMIQENTNTVLDVELAEDLTTQMNLYVASGDIPDIVTLSGFDFISYINTGYFLELTDLVDQYGPNLREYISQEAWDLTTINGQQYCVPYENFNKKHVTAIRTDWIENVGREVKQTYTLDEFADIMKAFTTEDPDQNGENDTYGLSGRNGVGEWQASFMSIFGAFGGIPTQYYNEDGTVVPFDVSDNFRNALVYINGLWEEGVIDPEIFILNVDQAVQKLIQGAAGTFIGWWSGPTSLYQNGLLDVDPDAYWDSIFITSNDGKTFGMKDNGLITQSTMISNKCENPEAAISFLDYLATEEGFNLAVNGVEGVHYDKDADGYFTKRSDINPDTVAPLSAMVSRLDLSAFQNAKPADTNDPAAYTQWRFMKIQWDDTLNTYTSLFYGIPATDAELEYSAELTSYVSQAVIEFITGEVPIDDANWNTYLSTWSKKGGQAILDSYVETYNELNGTSLKSMTVGQ
jgi:putative aldouronate transport system substrate-binding protein